LGLKDGCSGKWKKTLSHYSSYLSRNKVYEGESKKFSGFKLQNVESKSFLMERATTLKTNIYFITNATLSYAY